MNPISEFIIPIIIIAVLILFNGLFVAAEFAILAAPRARMARLAASGMRTASLVHYVQDSQDRQDRYIAAAQLGITAASLGLGMYGEHTVAEWLRPVFMDLGWFTDAALHTVSGLTAVAFLTYLHIVLGEMVPKSLALFHPDRTAMGVSMPMLWFSRIAFPMVALLNGIGRGFLRIFRVPDAIESVYVHSPEELEMIVEESHRTGALGEEESSLIVNVLHFSDMEVRKVMVPRTHVVGVLVDMPIQDVVQRVVETRHTRYPVYEESLDKIKGVLHVKELFKEMRRNPDSPDIQNAMRAPVFVPEQMTVENLLVEFKNHGSQIAVVLDEYGGTAGIVSLEDVLEEIFGEVQDEFDEEEPSIQRLGDRHAIIAGQLRLDEFEEAFGFDLERENVDTIGGLVLTEFGGPAQIGDRVEIDGIVFTVVALDGLAVGKVEAILPEAPADETGEVNGKQDS